MDLRLAWWLLRQVRSRALWLIMCLVIAVAGLIAVQGFSLAVEQALQREARNLLMADLSIDARRKIDPARLNALDTLVARRVAMAFANQCQHHGAQG